MAQLSILLFILIALAAAIILFCVTAYNRRLDKITSGQLHDTHSSIPEPSTTVNIIYKSLLIVFVIIALFSASASSGLLLSIQQNLSDLQSSQYQMTQEIRELQDQLERSNKLVSSFEYELTDPDYEKKTAEAKYTLRLRKYSADTVVTLMINGQEIPLSQDQAGTFSGHFTAHFFDDYANPMILVTENGITESEKADFPEYVFWNFLPMPSFNCQFTSNTFFGRMKAKGSYTLVIDSPNEIASASITYLTGGRELKTLDITRQVLGQEEIPLEEGLALEKDLTFRTEITTQSGLRIVEQSAMIYEAPTHLDEVNFLRILDQDGNIIWED